MVPTCMENQLFDNKKTFIIAEIGNNHNGSVTRAKLMIDKAIEAGADCVKFQMRSIKDLYRQKSIQKSGEDLGTEYILDLLKKYDLSTNQHKEIKNYCDHRRINYLCTPWDIYSAKKLESWGVTGYKVASADMSNRPLINELISYNKPLIISTGMSVDQDVVDLSNYLNEKNVKFFLLHCNSTYPAPFQDINLNWLLEMQKFHNFIGYSGHERGIAVSIAAVALGARVIERHFTLDKSMEGPDHVASLLPEEFKQMVMGIRELELALGVGKSRQLSQGEMINRENLGKSIVASRAIKLNEIITQNDLMIKSPGRGLSPLYIEKLVGRKSKRNIAKEDFFYNSDLIDEKIKPSKKYDFRLKWGLPVRFHDFAYFNSICQPKIWEFHFSYNDILLDPDSFLGGESEAEFAVHAPELFSESRLMDLTCSNKFELNKQLEETQRVIETTRTLKKFFPKTDRPLIIANIGGFTTNKPLNKIEIEERYEVFGESLSQLDLEGVELIPQTMAPFPWHFGGQRFQNLFLSDQDIIKYCAKFNLRICFDVSHSALYCNHKGLNLYKFSEKIAPFIAHIHFGDAIGVNGEGLQIGTGNIDFKLLSAALSKIDSSTSFIPEIWQGHKDHGAGFWQALDKLEEFF